MDIFRQPSDESSHGFTQSHKSDQESSSSEGSYSNRPTHSGEEEGVVLASSRPKKRAGRRIFKETRHPVYRGVRQRNKNKWVCELRVPNNNKTRIWLGTYPTAEMAARAHDVAALALGGKSACINFADSAWRLPLPASNDTDEIRRAAAEAAELFSDTAQQDQSLNNKVTDYEVCSSNVGVMEDAKPKQKEDMHVDEVAEVAQYDDDIQYHWVSRMADEPIRSPTPFLRDWSDCNIDSEFDAEVSLWSFSV